MYTKFKRYLIVETLFSKKSWKSRSLLGEGARDAAATSYFNLNLS